MSKEVVYENPPLIEVICELRWPLKVYRQYGNQPIDKYYHDYESEFSSFISEKGYKEVQSRIPADMPVEILGSAPVLQLRKEKDTWPLFQIGPGLFTANTVPPYNGWSSFRNDFHLGLEALYKSYPAASSLLKFSQMELRYINGFDEKFDYSPENFRDYSKHEFGFGFSLSEAIEKSAVEREKIAFISSFNFDLKDIKDSLANIKIAKGQQKNKDSLILELGITKKFKESTIQEQEDVAKWFDDAHRVISRWFDMSVSKKIREKMGKTKTIEVNN
ncbi:MAG: TIGR04255 family protein [Alphaproteobacteria bacterium]|nr:TIGR04255 family protein [Alphaproteobacteria bacterium]QQS58376.1 MAG: TIGR04255 family protein [Alphaproteobacteria bacterium]